MCDQEIRPEDDPEEARLKEKQMTRFIELIQAPGADFLFRFEFSRVLIVWKCMEWKDAIGEGDAEDMGLATLQCMCDTVLLH